MAVIQFLLVVIVGVTAREYTAEEVASFPKLFHLDDYDRCLARRDGLYCLGTFDLFPAEYPHPTYELLKAYSDESLRHFNRTRIHRGYCVSTRCPTLRFESNDSRNYDCNASRNFDCNASRNFDCNASLRFERCVDYYAQVRSLRASLNTLNYCHTHEHTTTTQPPTSAERIFNQLIIALVVMNIIGTIYDVYAEDGPNKNKLLSAFSIPANWRRLTIIQEEGDPRVVALAPIQGARIMALTVVTYAHACVMHYQFFITNPEEVEKQTQRIDGIFLSNGTSLIQAFVMLSCFLTCYNLLILSKKHELALHHLPLCIIKRVIRISPVEILMVGFGATWWNHTRSSPVVSSTIGQMSGICRTNFWSNILYVNNIVDAKDYCILPSWFLAADMHMYILACTLTLLLWRRRCTAVKLYAVLFFLSCLLTAVVAYVKQYKSFTYLATPELIRTTFSESPSYTEFYISSWVGLPSCFLGLILAHIQFELEERHIKLSEYKWFVFLHYITFPLNFTWALTGLLARKYRTSPLFNAVYIALDRPFYCIVAVITLLALIHIDGPLRRFYSWRGWHIMARMSLTVMLLHWCVGMSIGARPQAYATSVFEVLVDWIATYFITYTAAVPITVLVEYPMQKFFGSLLP